MPDGPALPGDEPAAIEAEGSLVSPDDERRRQLVGTVIANENKSVTGFAKHLVTVSFSAIGVIVALQQYTSRHATHRNIALLGTAIALLLAAGVTSSLAVQAFRLRVSPHDYSDVESELHRVARVRFILTRVALGLIVLAIVLAAAVIL